MRVTTAAELLGSDMEDLLLPFLAWNTFGSSPGACHPPSLQRNHNSGKLLIDQFDGGVAVLEALRHSLDDPIRYALPFFLLTIVIELVTLAVLGKSEGRFTARDSVTNLATGAVALALTAVVHAVELLLYAALYVYVAPWHLPADRWETWVGAFIGVDLLWYLYHRGSHRIRVMWAAHQVHHNSNYFNTTTAFRQKWNQWFGILIWLPLPLLGVPPWMVLAFFSAIL